MKYITTLFVGVLVLLSAVVCTAQSPESILPGTLVVKFASGSQLAAEWFAAGRRGQVEALTPLLGEHTTKSYISDATLTAVKKRLSSFSRKTGIAETISHICIIQYSRPLDPKELIRAVEKLPGVEYAEPMPERYISFVPNDPRVQEQYHLAAMRVFEAWDLLPTPMKDTVLIAIVDTGVDYLHEDIQDNIFRNPGEIEGNNLDDDGNGFIDDIRGWDFLGANGTKGDNDPRPGNSHGTHVAGLAGAEVNNATGVAGVALSAKILPVKIGIDNPQSRSVGSSYEGVMYAAAMGADVINCSWGGSTNSRAEGMIIDAAVDLGSTIVAAAGNEGREVAFYPASYPRVLSVAAVDEADYRSSFSNYHSSVDVSAPGSFILSTYPRPVNYATENGTSMSSPIVAGLAALVKLKYPTYTPLQIIEQIKATTDNIDEHLSSGVVGKLGTGRVNAYRALAESNTKAAVVLSYELEDANMNDIFEPGEHILLSANVLNVLSPVSNVRLIIGALSDYDFGFTTDNVSLGSMATYQQRSTAQMPFAFTIPQDIPLNYRLELELTIEDESGIIGREVIHLTLNPTYRTFKENNITVTFNSVGNIGFNDYPDNEQGEGFRYLSSANLLYEGGLMVAASPERISSVVRGPSSEAIQDKSFYPTKLIDLKIPGVLSLVEGVAEFRDAYLSSDAGVQVRQTVYQSDSTGMENAVFVVYEITNKSGEDMASLHAGMYFDWDIGISGANDIASFYAPDNFGYVYNARDRSLPFIGMQLHTEQELNFFAIDNDGTTLSNPGTYDGFTRAEKWQMMSSGIGRSISNTADVSAVISAGPIRLANNATVKVAFSLFAGSTFDSLQVHGRQAREIASAKGLGNRQIVAYDAVSELLNVFPNPFTGDHVSVTFSLASRQSVTLQIVDLVGRVITTETAMYKAGFSEWTVPGTVVSSLASGTYLVQFITADAIAALPLRIVH